MLVEVHGQAALQPELSALLDELAAASRAEPGCEWFRVLQSKDQPGEFVLLSMWNDDAAVRAHYESPHFDRYRTQVGLLLARPSSAEVLVISEITRLLDPNPPEPRQMG
jgi:autoinducer 2-degrading protein